MCVYVSVCVPVCVSVEAVPGGYSLQAVNMWGEEKTMVGVSIRTVNIGTLGPEQGFAFPLSMRREHSHDAELLGSLTSLCLQQPHMFTQSFTCPLQTQIMTVLFPLYIQRKVSRAEFNLSMLIYLKFWKEKSQGKKATINNAVIKMRTRIGEVSS